MKIFSEHVNESIESIGNSLEFILSLLDEKELSSRLFKFERDSMGDITSIGFDVNDVSTKKRELIVRSLHRNGFKTAALEFHDWNKVWIINIDRIRIQRKSTAVALVSGFYYGLIDNPGSKSIDQPIAKPSMLDRLMGKGNK